MNTFFVMSTLILRGGQVVLGLAALGAAIYLGIFATKIYLKQQSEKIRTEGGEPTSSLVRKYEAVDMQQHAKNIKLAGFASAMAVVLILFAWTQFTSDQVLADFFVEPEAIEMDVPVTAFEKPELPAALPPPPPKPGVDIEIVDTPEPEPDPDPTPDPVVDISPTPSSYTGPTDVNSTTLPPVIQIVEAEEPEVEEDVEVLIAEQMPRFPGCEEQGGDNDSKKICADQKLLGFIYDNIRYPSMARENNIEGTVVVTFVVNKDGSLEGIKILKEPGGGCGKEAARVIKMMNKMSAKWTPGKQRGKAVKVRYNLPVRFKLNN